MSSSWGNSWLNTWGDSWGVNSSNPGGAIVEIEPIKRITIPSNNVNDYQGYVVLNSTAISLSTEHSEDGQPSFKGEITGASGTNDQNLPHRGYGYIHLDELPVGPFRTPVKISFRVWLDITLQTRIGTIDDWFSFATMGIDSDWGGLFTVNLNTDGYVYLQHVPVFGSQDENYQASAQNNGLRFPMQQWVALSIVYDGRPGGKAEVYQDGVLVSKAYINSGNGFLSRVHLGMYASPAVSSGVVFNKSVVIEEIVLGGTSTKKPRQISEDEAKGMAAVYGAQMVTIDQPAEIDQEIEQEAFLQPFDLPNGTFKEPIEPQTVASLVIEDEIPFVDNVDSLLIEPEKEDDIALILAIIEAIG